MILKNNILSVVVPTNKYFRLIPALPIPSVDITERSVTLSFDTPPPEVTGDLERSITQYAVTLTPQDGGDPISVFVLAEVGAIVTIRDLESGTTYEVAVNAVIHTAGQGEETYDLGFTPMIVEISKLHHN